MVEDFRGADTPRCCLSQSAYRFDCDACSHWYSEGVSLGRKFQRNEEWLARYKSRIRAQATENEQDVQKRDAKQIKLQPRIPVEFGLWASAYSNPEPPSDISDLSEHYANCGRTGCRSDDEAQDIPQIVSLMSAAHGGDSIALQRVRTLIRAAERTPKWQRTPAQTHLLVSWRCPKTRATITFPSPEPLKIFVDASAYGIGFIVNNMWLAWKFITAHPLLPLGPDGNLIASWAELVAVEVGIRTLIAAGIRNVSVTVHSDNQGVVWALESGKWTQKYDLNEIVRRILRLSHKAELTLEMKWISTKENPADNPSRGVYPPTELKICWRPSIPHSLSELIQEVE